MRSNPDVVVVGAGAAGIFAAWRAATLGAKVLLLEKTSRIGTKILVSGGGKCNVAHAGSLESVIAAFRPNEARFIRPACYKFTNEAIVEFMTERGLRVYTRPDGRVFPVDQTAKDVVAILKDALDQVGVEIRLNSPVQELITSDGMIRGVRVGSPRASHAGYRSEPTAKFGAKALLAQVMADTEPVEAKGAPYELMCQTLVVCTGGNSYPNSGTTGDGWNWARSLGHSIVKIRGALAPIYLKSADASLSGLALRDCVLRARHGGKELIRWSGDLLFTHQGVSGPTALAISRSVGEALEKGVVLLEVDLCPGKTQEKLAEELLAWSQSSPRKLVVGYVEGIVPSRFASIVIHSAAIAPDTPFSRLDKKSRNRLAATLKSLPIGEVRHVPIEKGEVSAGGIDLQEVDPKTLRSSLVKGLYLCGEVLDVAGPVGGYNLQAAFATGFLAGESAALAARLPTEI